MLRVAAVGFCLVLSSPALAEITVVLAGWDSIPRVVVVQGRSVDCGQNTVVFDGPMTRGQRVGPFPNTGTSGDDICWRRTADPLSSSPDLQSFWTRCSGFDECEIS